MAILPRTLLTQPAPAAVAAVALFGFTVVGLAAQQTLDNQDFVQRYSQPCVQVSKALGAQNAWGPGEYAQYATCFENVGDEVGALEVATQGVEQYPASELLVNIKGYHLIGFGEYESAVDTLEEGLRTVRSPTTGTMENNLAWSYLYVGRGGSPDALKLYRRALQRSPRACELVHTGMFVEYESAMRSSPLNEVASLVRFANLQENYVGCEMRDEAWETAIEAIGAAVLYDQLSQSHGWEANTGASTLARAVATTSTSSVTAVCEEAMPIARLRGRCVEMVEEAR